MDGRDSVRSLLVLRKLTRAIADAVRQQMTEYLAGRKPVPPHHRDVLARGLGCDPRLLG